MARDRRRWPSASCARPRSTTATPSPATTRRWPTPCPNCGGVVKENYRRFTCTGTPGDDEGCGFSISKIPGGRSLRARRGRAFLRDKKIGPLEGFRSKAGWPFTAELKLVLDDEINNWKLEFDFGEDAKKRRRVGRAGRLLRPGEPGRLPQVQGPCLRARHQLRLRARGRRARHLRLQERQDHPAAAGGARADDQAAGHRQDRPAGELRLQQDAAQVQGRLAYDEKEGKVGFEFEPRAPQGAGRPRRRAAKKAAAKKAAGVTRPAGPACATRGDGCVLDVACRPTPSAPAPTACTTARCACAWPRRRWTARPTTQLLAWLAERTALPQARLCSCCAARPRAASRCRWRCPRTTWPPGWPGAVASSGA